jgi:arginine utilization regulatory protein
MRLPEKLADSVLKGVEEGIIILNGNNEIIYFSDPAGRLLQLKEKDGGVTIKLPEAVSHLTSTIVSFNDKKLNFRWQRDVYLGEEIIIGYIEDVTNYVNLQTRVLKLEEILDNVNDGVIALNTRGKITVYNRALSEIESINRCEVLGKELKQVYKGHTNSNSMLHSVMKSRKPNIGYNETYNTKSGREINIISSTYPVFHDNELIGSYSICRNLTKIRDLLDSTLRLNQGINHNKLQRLHKKSDDAKYTLKDIVGNSNLIKKALAEAERASKSNSPVLVVGDTGTGKEMFIQGIHEESYMNEKHFVPINCAAIPETLLESMLFGTTKGAFTGAEETAGLFQQAGEGTLLLDEINSMGTNLQAKLLRVLQENMVRKVGGKKEIPVKCRVMSTINKDPQYCIEEGSLRRDLFYRLAVLTIYIPSLRERIDDLEPLAKHFIDKFNQQYQTSVQSISPDLMDIFYKYNWPGNVRELQHLIEGAIAMMESEKIIKLEHLPTYFYNHFSKNKANITYTSNTLAQTLRDAEERTILQTLSDYRGNVTQAAKTLGIARQNLNYRIRKLGIDMNTIRR